MTSVPRWAAWLDALKRARPDVEVLMMTAFHYDKVLLTQACAYGGDGRAHSDARLADRPTRQSDDGDGPGGVIFPAMALRHFAASSVSSLLGPAVEVFDRAYQPSASLPPMSKPRARYAAIRLSIAAWIRLASGGVAPIKTMPRLAGAYPWTERPKNVLA